MVGPRPSLQKDYYIHKQQARADTFLKCPTSVPDLIEDIFSLLAFAVPISPDSTLPQKD